MKISTTIGESRIVTVDRISRSGDRIAYPRGDTPGVHRKPDGIHLPATYRGNRVLENETYEVEIVARDEGYPRAKILRRIPDSNRLKKASDGRDLGADSHPEEEFGSPVDCDIVGLVFQETQESSSNRVCDTTVEEELKERYADFMADANRMYRPN